MAERHRGSYCIARYESEESIIRHLGRIRGFREPAAGSLVQFGVVAPVVGPKTKWASSPICPIMRSLVPAEVFFPVEHLIGTLRTSIFRGDIFVCLKVAPEGESAGKRKRALRALEPLLRCHAGCVASRLLNGFARAKGDRSDS